MASLDIIAIYRMIQDDFVSSLFKKQPLVSDQVSTDDVRLVLEQLGQVINRQVPGDIVEFGCYIGTTSLFIRRLLDEAGESDKRAFHVYDSFAGLPAKTIQDQSVAGEAFRAGELSVSKKEFLRQFYSARVQPPIVHKAWFGDLTDKDVPQQIAFAFLDGDFYQSILDSLKLVWPRMSQGGVVLIDDYGREALPGPERAVRDFFGGKLPTLHHQHNIGIIRV